MTTGSSSILDSDPLTRISVHFATPRLLRRFKAGGRSGIAAVLRFVERCPPLWFLNEMAHARTRIFGWGGAGAE